MYLAIIILPLLGSIVSGFFGRKTGISGAQIFTCTAVVTTTILAVFAFFEVGLNNIPVSIEVFRWIDSESLNVYWAFHFDSLTVSMLIPVLIVSSLVHIYSIGYMSEDPHIQRFFSYLSLFTFMMVILVTANNFLLMFVGWEGVGVCSYLLVCFWFARIAANQSSLSAFLTNRVGDCFLTIGMFAILLAFGNGFLTRCRFTSGLVWGLGNPPKPHAFTSLPLQSGVFKINRHFIINLFSSIITAAMGYGIRLILLRHLNYDLFTHLDNSSVSLSYFCSLGGIRFVIYEYIKENTILMYYCGDSMAVPKNAAGSDYLRVDRNPANYSLMQAPNDSGIASSSNGTSSIPDTADKSTTVKSEDHSTNDESSDNSTTEQSQVESTTEQSQGESTTNSSQGDTTPNPPQGNNSFSTPNDDIGFCEHRSRNRVPFADSDEFRQNNVNCNFCGQPALNGTEGQTAIICEGCGCAICEGCNEPNSDSDNDSGLGEE